MLDELKQMNRRIATQHWTSNLRRMIVSWGADNNKSQLYVLRLATTRTTSLFMAFQFLHLYVKIFASHKKKHEEMRSMSSIYVRTIQVMAEQRIALKQHTQETLECRAFHMSKWARWQKRERQRKMWRNNNKKKPRNKQTEKFHLRDFFFFCRNAMPTLVLWFV